MAKENDLPALCSLHDFLKQDFDFVIVGGGTAGLAVAARLSENPNIHVGVLEAGKAHVGDPLISIPALHGKTSKNPKYDWMHNTVPQKGQRDTTFRVTRGRGLGGTSNINYQMYSRGHKSDYADWEKLGIKGWSFDELLPYFKKSESLDDPKEYLSQLNLPLETNYASETHGKSGPIHTSFNTWRCQHEKAFVDAAVSLGMGPPADPWSGEHLGVYQTMTTIDRRVGPANATRSTATSGYFLPNAHRSNLKVLCEAVVSKLEVSKSSVVTGIHFLHSETSHFIGVKKEVILSAGTIKSPQVLELSGIGNPSILSAAGIDCLVNNSRVGENYQDHAAALYGYELIAEGPKTLDIFQDGAEVQKAMAEYMATHSGPLSSTPSTNLFAAYASLSTAAEIAALKETILSPAYGGHRQAVKEIIAESIGDVGSGNIQLIILPISMNVTDISATGNLNIPPQGQLGKQGVTIAVGVQRGLSVGSIHVINNDPLVDPAIDPEYLSHPGDLEILGKGLELATKIANTSPFKELIKRRYGPEDDSKTKKNVEDNLRGHVVTTFHPIGTVSIGLEGEGACDDLLRVWGCTGLRVVDASVIPLHISGNIIATVYAIAEKAAYMIKSDWDI